MNFNTKIHSNTICKKYWLLKIFHLFSLTTRDSRAPCHCQMPILSSSAFQNHDGTPEFPVVRITNDGPGTKRRECAKKVPGIFWFPSQDTVFKNYKKVLFCFYKRHLIHHYTNNHIWNERNETFLMDFETLWHPLFCWKCNENGKKTYKYPKGVEYSSTWRCFSRIFLLNWKLIMKSSESMMTKLRSFSTIAARRA